MKASTAMNNPTNNPGQLTDTRWINHPDANIPDTIQGLIFDLVGTLLDTMAVHYQAWLTALAETKITLTESRFYALAGTPTEKIASILCAEHGHSNAAALAHAKEQNFLARLPEIKPVQPVLALARRESGRRKLAVASGGTRSVVTRELAVIGIENFFPVVVCADDVRHGKPAPDTFLEAARRMDLEPWQCAVYEDAELGFQAAKTAGMYAVDVRPWYIPRR
ncbi:MAG: HAD-IA family hydrolase [Phycisphaerae bacterium]|nr:HAD-IA family hydrolase [Phycisphaerae bacterium]